MPSMKTMFLSLSSSSPPRLSGALGKIVTKHWRTMINTDPRLREVFPAPPLTAYKVNRNLGTFLIRARIPRPVPFREHRVKNGMHRCKKNLRGCPVCYFVFETSNLMHLLIDNNRPQKNQSICVVFVYMTHLSISF